MMNRMTLGAAAAVVVLTPVPAIAQGTNTRLSYGVPATEQGDVAIDSSGYLNNGVLRGGVTRVNGAYKFHRLSADGRYDRIHAPNSASLNPGTSPFTYSVRLKVKPDAEWHNSEMAILRHGDSDMPGGDYKMELAKIVNGVVTADCVMHDNDGQGAGYVRGTGGITINDGHWHTIACSRASSNTVSLTVDGRIAVRTTHGDLGSVKGPVPLLIGCQHQGGGKKEPFVGKMDDITITVP
jgi:hypothetical protein